jgi:hypothetical protein
VWRNLLLIYGSAIVVGGFAVLAAADAVGRWSGTVGLALLCAAMVAERLERRRLGRTLGEDEHPRVKRGHDRRRPGWGTWFDRFITMFAVGVAFYAIVKVVNEGAARRDETCKLFERQHAADVKQVTATIDFLRNPPPQLAGLVGIARAQLKDTYVKAVASTEPGYCNEPGVGLAEPGPKLPPPPVPPDPFGRPFKAP